MNDQIINRRKSDNIRSISAHNNKRLLQARSIPMDASVNMDPVKNNYDVKPDMTTDSNDILNSSNFLRIPLKPIEQYPVDEFINEKR